MKKPTGIAALLPHDGVIKRNCTRWYILQMVFDWNQKGHPPTFVKLRDKIDETMRAGKIGIYFGLGHSLSSMLEELTKIDFVGVIPNKNGENFFYVTPEGQNFLCRCWVNVDEESLEFERFFKGDKTLIPKVQPLRKIG